MTLRCQSMNVWSDVGAEVWMPGGMATMTRRGSSVPGGGCEHSVGHRREVERKNRLQGRNLPLYATTKYPPSYPPTKILPSHRHPRPDPGIFFENSITFLEKMRPKSTRSLRSQRRIGCLRSNPFGVRHDVPTRDFCRGACRPVRLLSCTEQTYTLSHFQPTHLERATPAHSR